MRDGCYKWARANHLSTHWERLRDNGSKSDVIVRDPEILNGTPVFRGTRVPLQALFDYLEAGDSLDDFLAGFPTVSRTQAVQVLEECKAREQLEALLEEGLRSEPAEMTRDDWAEIRREAVKQFRARKPARSA